MKTLRHLGSLAFVLGLFTAVFAGVPWAVISAHDPSVPMWLRVAIFSLLGGILVVLLTVALEQLKNRPTGDELPVAKGDSDVLILSSLEVPGREITEILGVVQGHTVFAVWLGKDLSALVKLVLGGELTEYTEMMGRARTVAADRMAAEAKEVGADAVINARYMTTSVVGTAAELLAYGTAVKLNT
jgi:uncharacterized protein YbjQ (UPF0145 family)